MLAAVKKSIVENCNIALSDIQCDDHLAVYDSSCNTWVLKPPYTLKQAHKGIKRLGATEKPSLLADAELQTTALQNIANFATVHLKIVRSV